MSFLSRAYPVAIWECLLDGKSLKDKLQERLISLTIIEHRGDEADQLTVELSDHDGALEIPPLDAELRVSIGWSHSGLVDKGTYLIDEVGHSGTPDRLIIRGRSADFGGPLRTRSERSFHKKTIGAIVGEIAKANSLEAIVSPALEKKVIPHIDQTEESDAAFLSRIGKRFDAVATVKEGRLLFMPIHGAKKSDDKTEMPVFELSRADGDNHYYQQANRDAYSGVKAFWMDTRKGKKQSVVVGVLGNAKHLRETFATEDDALAEAQAEWQRLKRGQAKMSYTLAVSKPELTPQCFIVFKDMKPPISTTRWLIETLTHRLDDSGGLNTAIELETEGQESVSDSLEEDDSD